jgi:hypothetical protein
VPGEWKGPDKLWAAHDWAIGRDVMDLARAHGWSFRTIEGHPHGELRCPAGEHMPKVPGTPKSGEAKFIDLKKLITNRCAHGTGNAPKLERARKLIETTRALVEAAEESADRYLAARDGDAAFAEAVRVETLLTADVIDANVDELLQLRDALLEEAAAAPDAPSAESILEAIEEIRANAKRIRHELKTLSKPLGRPLLDEVDDLEARTDAVERVISP